MNKLFFVILAICLISAHAFVKRDAPAPAAGGEDSMKKLQEQLSGMAKQIQESLEGTFNSEQIKKSVNEFVDSVSKGIESLKPKQ